MMQRSTFTPGRRAPGADAPAPAASASAASDELFFDLLGRYRAHGGLASLARVEALLRRRAPGCGEVLANWTRNGDVLWLDWRDEVWVPMFQLRAGMGGELVPRADVQALSMELRCVCDGLDLCRWFVQPNGWLDGRAPVAVLDENPGIVRAAARADRFVLGG